MMSIKRLSRGRMVAIAASATLSLAGTPAFANVSPTLTEGAHPGFPCGALKFASSCVEAGLPAGQPTSQPEAAPASIHSTNDSSPQAIAQATLPFSDVPPDHWAYEALLYLSTGDRAGQP